MSPFHYLFDKIYPLIRFIYERVMGHQWYEPITDDLWLGGAPSYKRDYDFLLAQGIGAVVDIRQEREDDLVLYKKNDIRHIKLRVPDVYVPPADIITEGVDFIHQNLREGRKVYVHCAKGRSRSATLVAAYLMKYMQMSSDEAHEYMLGRRALVKLQERHITALDAWIVTQDTA